MVQFGKAFAVKQSYQTGQKLMENAKIQKFECDILGDFQTLCKGVPLFLNHGQVWADSQKSIFSFVGTYPGFEKLTHKALPGLFKRLAYVSYQDLTSVNLHTDKPEFVGLPDGMTLMVSQK